MTTALDGGAAGSLQLSLDQDLDLRRGKLAETTFALTAGRGPFAAGARAAFLAQGGRPWRDPRPDYRSRLDTFTRLTTWAALHDRRGDALTATFSAVGPGWVGAQAAGVDALFDLRPTAQPGSAGINLQAKLRLGPAAATYDVVMAGRRIERTCTVGGGVGGQPRITHPGFGEVERQRAALVWDSPCHCFTFAIAETYDSCSGFSGPEVKLDLSRLMQGTRGG